MTLAAHLRTVLPRLRRPASPPPADPWQAPIVDPDIGLLTLTGKLRQEPGASGLVICVHGITGCADAPYARRLAAVAAAMGLSCLRLNLRGCDRRGEDYYHAGLCSDIGVAISTPELAAYSELFLVGYSIGGHLALGYACNGPDPRLKGAVAICSPLDLVLANRHFDSPAAWPYRRYVIGNYRRIYAPVAARRPVPVPPEVAARFTHMAQWDGAVVAPRWGFTDVEDYYRRASVAPHLGRLAAPALLIAVDDDPVVPGAVLRPALAGPVDGLEVRWIERGGHVAFSPALDLGQPGPPGLEGQLLGWLLSC